MQLLLELQKVALKADGDDGGPVQQTLSTFADELGIVVDKQLKVFLLTADTAAFRPVFLELLISQVGLACLNFSK